MTARTKVKADYAPGDVERLIGLTQRQLSYWATTDLIRPQDIRGSGHGRRLRYSYEDLVRLSVIKRLLDAGMSLQAIRRSVAFLRTLPDVAEPLTDVYLTSDGSTIYAQRSTDEVLDALRDGQMVLALGLEGVVRQLDAKIIELLRQRPVHTSRASESA